MDNKAKIATGAGLATIIAAALGYSGYEQFKHAQSGAFLPPSTVQLNQRVVNPSAPSAPLSTELPPTALPSAQTNVQLNAQRGLYAPVPAASSGNVYSSSVSSTRDTQTEAPVSEETTTKTSVKTAYTHPSTTGVHQAYVSRGVRYEQPGNVHVVRAMKHTIGFTAKLPFRLRF